MDAPKGSILDRFVKEIDGRRSIELRATLEHRSDVAGQLNGAVAATGRRVEHYIETSFGQRFWEEVVDPHEVGAKLIRYYCDGARCADESRSGPEVGQQAMVRVKRTFISEGQSPGSGRPTPLRSLYLVDRPLARSLSGAKPIGEAKHIGRPCELFLFADVDWGGVKHDIVIWFDRETAIPVREVFYEDTASRLADQPERVWEAESVEIVEGHPFPLNSTETLFAKSFQRSAPLAFAKFDPGTPIIVQKWQVDEIHFNRDYPAATFWPVVEPQAAVLDEIAKKYERPKSEKAVVSQSSTNAATQLPSAAAPPTGWMGWISWGSIGLGLALVLIALVKRRG